MAPGTQLMGLHGVTHGTQGHTQLPRAKAGCLAAAPPAQRGGLPDQEGVGRAGLA